ncbi:MAG: pantetheine-phosphate adenylyltransferase [Selenomonadaceae bacterium]|nr:pantetheine-phosphate adenylyltransferase [Selenomonadaceae bacterium]
MRKGICTGSFDPVTNGHINIFERAAKLVDELTVCVFVNKRKTYLFDVEERVKLLQKATEHIPNVKVDSFDGLVADYVKLHDINTIIRGLRSTADFETEFNQAQFTKYLTSEVEIIFLLTEIKFSFISSSGVRELAKFHGDISGLVPKCVEVALKKKIEEL